MEEGEENSRRRSRRRWRSREKGEVVEKAAADGGGETSSCEQFSQ